MNGRSKPALYRGTGEGQAQKRATTDDVRQDNGLADGHKPSFFQRLNKLLREYGFDDFVEAECASSYAATMGG